MLMILNIIWVCLKDGSWLQIQLVDATHWLILSTGVSTFNVSLGLSLSRFATAFNLFW